MKYALPFVAAILMTACQAVVPGTTGPSAGPPSANADLIVRYQATTASAARDAIRLAHNAGAAVSIGLDAERWSVGSAEAADLAIADLNKDARVRYAQPNYHRTLTDAHAPDAGNWPHFSLEAVNQRVLQAVTPTDPDYNLQWHLPRGHFPEAWATTTGKGVIVSVIDSGCDPDHPDLKANLLPLIDEVVATGNHDVFNNDNYDRRDGHGHGTHVCGIIGAVANNGLGGSGAAPNVKILPVKVTTSSGDADDTTISKGILDAVDHGAQVINLSIGGPEPSPILLDALNYAFNKNVAVVIASGNDGHDVNYPAAYNGVISVGSITDKDKVASYSSHGKTLVMVAPGGGPPGRAEGEAIYSTTPTYPCYITVYDRKSSNYGYLAGTSMSAPQVTAAAALLLSVAPGLTPAQVRTRLAAGADQLGSAGFDEYFGYGVLNIKHAIDIGSDDGRTVQ
jgi:subtilisin family serine protease